MTSGLYNGSFPSHEAYIFRSRAGSVGRSRDIIYMIINRGKSGLRGKGCQVTPGHWLNSDGKCHRKQTASKEVRVKRWGKSPPQAWQHGWLGKPRLEQGQVSGESTHLDQDAAGRLLESTSDRAPREMTVTVVIHRTEPGL